HGCNLWSRFVEPPWEFSVAGEVITVDVMGSVSRIHLRSGELASPSRSVEETIIPLFGSANEYSRLRSAESAFLAPLRLALFPLLFLKRFQQSIARFPLERPHKFLQRNRVQDAAPDLLQVLVHAQVAPGKRLLLLDTKS